MWLEDPARVVGSPEEIISTLTRIGMQDIQASLVLRGTLAVSAQTLTKIVPAFSQVQVYRHIPVHFGITNDTTCRFVADIGLCSARATERDVSRGLCAQMVAYIATLPASGNALACIQSVHYLCHQAFIRLIMMLRCSKGNGFKQQHWDAGCCSVKLSSAKDTCSMEGQCPSQGSGKQPWTDQP